MEGIQTRGHLSALHYSTSQRFVLRSGDPGYETYNSKLRKKDVFGMFSQKGKGSGGTENTGAKTQINDKDIEKN